MIADGKYSLLFMRDDSRVRRLRLSPFWLRLGAYFLIMLPLAAGAGLYGAVHFWREAQALGREKTGLERQLAEVRLRLERLENVERLLKGGDVEDLKNVQPPSAAPLSGASTPSPLPAAEGRTADKGDRKDVALPPVDLAALLTKVDLRQVGVDNLKVGLADDQIKVAFDLTNLGQTPLAGQVALWLVTNSGQQIKAAAPETDLAFQIQRLKKAAVTFPLPKGFERKDFYALRLVVTGPSGVIFSETFPLSALLG